MAAKRLRRSERGLGARPRTLKTRQLVAEVRREAEILQRSLPILEDERPRHRSDCERGPRPCPWVGCRFHLFLDVKEGGYLRYNFPDRDLGDLEETCALDVAESGSHTLEQVGDLVNMGRDHLLRVERAARGRLREEIDRADVFDADDDEKGDF
jgi:hypothetical protein